MKKILTFHEVFLWCKRQMYHLVFVSALAALTVLVTWWAIFLYQSVDLTYDTMIDGIRNSTRSYGMFLGHNPEVKPKLGTFAEDQRLEIVHKHSKPSVHSLSLLPYWQGMWLKPKDDVVTQIQEKRKRRHVMVVGESSFLLLLILVSGAMIYRMYWLEKRTTQELHELWSRVSHEIKTPITGVKAFLETLQAQDLSRDEVEPLLKLALKQVERQQQLTENMLVGQKLKRRASGVKLQPIHLNTFIQTYLESHSFPDSISLTPLDPTPSDPTQSGPSRRNITVSADPEALRIIFDNIIENARKYGGPEVKVQIGVEISGRKTAVVFQDNGPGFEPEMAEAIFKAYKRLGDELPGRQHKGTGMGLYICRRLAKQMGGQLNAWSEGKGKGAGFVLTLKHKPLREE